MIESETAKKEAVQFPSTTASATGHYEQLQTAVARVASVRELKASPTFVRRWLINCSSL